MKKIITILFLIPVLHASAQNNVAIGQTSQNLVFPSMKNFERDSASLSDFKGKVVVLDFWATWCSPCIAAFPALENLQAEFQNDLQIITVTDDSDARITKFLGSKKMSLPIVVDPDRQLAKYFPHRSIPHSIIIDRFGIVQAITSGDRITRDVIVKALANEKLLLPEKKDNLKFDPEAPLSGNSNFTSQITVTPFQAGSPSMISPNGGSVYKDRRILAMNLSPKSLYEVAYQFPLSNRTEIAASNKDIFKWTKENAICMEIIMPEGRGGERFEVMKQQLNNIYTFKATIVKKLRKVKVLKVINRSEHHLTIARGGESNASYGGKGLSMTNSKVEQIAAFLESQFSIPAIDETKLSGLYDVRLDWFTENPNAIHAELKKLGLELIEAEREIDILVISD